MNKDIKKTLTVHSMTGFSNVQSTTTIGTLSMELRSINSRFLDIQFRMPEDLRAVEALVREKLVNALGRGKVECRISWVRSDNEKRVPKVDLEQVRKLAQLEASIQSELPHARGFRMSEVLNWPGVFEDNALSADELQHNIAVLADQAIEALKQTRAREGTQLLAVLLEKIDGMQVILDNLLPMLPQFLAHYEDKIRERLSEAFQQMPQDKTSQSKLEDWQERIRQEVALHGVRIDVQEEIERLQTHLIEIRRILQKGGVVGKRLDFVAQELNREANTLGSKSHAIAQTQASIDLKVLIEQFKEQIQNIE